MIEMIYTTYYIILIYFLLGAVGFYLINRKEPVDVARQIWTKYISYFFIINILFFSIVIKPVAFRCFSVLIIVIAALELLALFVRSGYKNKRLFLSAIMVFGISSLGFFWYSGLDKKIILFSFLILSIFDSFSQISGMLFGHNKIFPKVSPNKTLGGFIGGTIMAALTALLLQSLYPKSVPEVLLMATGIIVFAFTGDIAASYYKRKYQVKDYSNLIPGHGGFLDRFDSLIAAGAWVAFIQFINF